MSVRAAARMTALRPGQSPPPVRIPIRFTRGDYTKAMRDGVDHGLAESGTPSAHQLAVRPRGRLIWRKAHVHHRIDFSAVHLPADRRTARSRLTFPKTPLV